MEGEVECIRGYPKTRNDKIDLHSVEVMQPWEPFLKCERGVVGKNRLFCQCKITFSGLGMLLLHQEVQFSLPVNVCVILIDDSLENLVVYPRHKLCLVKEILKSFFIWYLQATRRAQSKVIMLPLCNIAIQHNQENLHYTTEIFKISNNQANAWYPDSQFLSLHWDGLGQVRLHTKNYIWFISWWLRDSRK